MILSSGRGPSLLTLGWLLSPGLLAQELAPVRDTIPGTSIAFPMVWVDRGSVALGDGAIGGEASDEGPSPRIEVKGFWIGAHEVSHDEFDLFRHRHLDTERGPTPGSTFDVDAVTRPSPPYEDPAHGMEKAGYPATGMTRLAAARYARWLSLKTGRLYRLPTEAEWEHACRANGAGGGLEAEDPWHREMSNGAYRGVAEGGEGTLGIRNMVGNVAEWVWDDYRADRYDAVVEGGSWELELPLGRGRGSVRGGSFDDPPDETRCGNRIPESRAWKRRDPQVPKSRWWNTDSPHVGFRLVRVDGDHTLSEIVDFWERALPP